MRIEKELDSEAIVYNINRLKKIAGYDTKIMATVKSDAYGHGMIKVVKAIDDYVSMYSVANIKEAIELRKYLRSKDKDNEKDNDKDNDKEKEIKIVQEKVENTEVEKIKAKEMDDKEAEETEIKEIKETEEKGILILGYFDEERVNELMDYNIIQGISNFESLDIIEHEINKEKSIEENKNKEGKIEDNKNENKKVKVHIKVNTGMNRLGFDINEDFFKRIVEYKNIIIDGVFSHIPYADDYQKQKEIENNFDNIINQFNLRNIDIPKKHLLNSSGIFNTDLKRYDYVRPGIAMYGYYPSPKVKSECLNVSDTKEKNKIVLKQCLTIKTKIINIRDVKKGEKISYEGTYELPEDKVIAVLPIGYDDGYLRSNSNKARVFVNGKYANVVGRVCMNLTMIDVTDIEGSIGDEVIILGKEISAEELANISQTISYEILCNFKVE